eukprot:SAG22_NODE_146_length_17566_cov_17.597847_13_plen_643_part_00
MRAGAGTSEHVYRRGGGGARPRSLASSRERSGLRSLSGGRSVVARHATVACTRPRDRDHYMASGTRLLLLLMHTLAPGRWLAAGHQPATPEFDCRMRGMLFERARQLLAPSRAAERQAVFDALQLGASCNESSSRPEATAAAAAGSDFALGRPSTMAPGNTAATFYVAAWGGDGAPGSRASPFASLERARAAARAVERPPGSPGARRQRVSVLLRCRPEDGPRCIFHLNRTLVLGPEDSFTSWGAEPGAAHQVVISGGVPLTQLQWQPVRPGGATAGTPHGLQQARLPAGVAASFSSLFVNGQRAVRARTPNGNMERSLCLNPQFMSSGRVGPQYCPSHFPPPPISGVNSWDLERWNFGPMLYREGCADVPPGADAKQFPECFGEVIEVSEPFRNGTSWQGGMNPRYTKFVGGAQKRWDPPEAVASVRSLYGGCMSGGIVPPMDCITSNVDKTYPSMSSNVTNLCPCTCPGGVRVPNTTFSRTWANASTGVAHAFHTGFWGLNMYAVSDRQEAGNLSVLTYAMGGFQMAQGSAGHREWFVENIREGAPLHRSLPISAQLSPRDWLTLCMRVCFFLVVSCISYPTKSLTSRMSFSRTRLRTRFFTFRTKHRWQLQTLSYRRFPASFTSRAPRQHRSLGLPSTI